MDHNERSEDIKNEKKNFHRKRKMRYSTIPIVFALAFVLIYALINSTGISSFLSSLMSVFSPIIIGFSIAYLLNPILRTCESKLFKGIKNKTAKRVISLIFTYLFALTILTAILFLIIPQLIDSVSLFTSKYNYYIDSTISLINDTIATFMGSRSVSPTVSEEDLLNAVSSIFNTSSDIFETVGDYIVQYGTGLVVGVKNVLIALFISIYVLASKDTLKAQGNKIATAMLSEEKKARFYRYLRLCDKTFGGFFIGKIIDSLIIGAITLITLLIFDMPYEVLVATIICITNIIPVFGPIIGAIPSFFIIFIVDPSKAFLFLILILIIQQLDGNVIGPKILGNSTGLSSLGVIVAITIMGDYFGVIGMLLGVPIFAVAMTIITEFVENKLRKKNLPVNTAEYYPAEDVVVTEKPRRTLMFRFFSYTFHLIGRTFRRIFKKKKNTSSKNDIPQKEEINND